MSIHNKRLTQLTEQILRESLQDGILPSSKEFVWKMNQAMQGQKLSEPRYRFKAYRNSAIIQSSEINESNDKIHDDLSILYDNIIDIHKSLNKYQSSFEVEKMKLDTQISELQNELKEKIMAYNAPGFLGYAFDRFDNLLKVDKEASTDIFVDTKEKEVRLVEEKNTSSRIYPSTSFAFDVIEEIETKREDISGKLKTLIRPEDDIPWQTIIRTKENQTLTAVLQLSFDKNYSINKIIADFLTIKKLLVKIEFSTNGTTWMDIPYYQDFIESKGTAAFQFPTLSMRAIRFVIKKEDSDETTPLSDGFTNSYLYGAKSVELYNKQYPSTGLFQTEPLSIANAPSNYRIDRVKLIVDEVVPTGTTIDYEIAIPSADGVNDWHPIDPVSRINTLNPQELRFSNIKRGESLEMFYPKDRSVVQSEVAGLTTNGVPVYRLSTQRGDKIQQYIQNKAILDGTLKLYTGRNSWEVVSYPSTSTGIPSLEQWSEVKDGMKYRYNLMNNSKNGEVFKNWTDPKKQQYICKAGFFIGSNDMVIKTTPICTDPMSIYVNGENVYQAMPGNTQPVNISLKTGWNEIAILINGQNAVAAAGISMSLGFNPQAISQHTYSSSSPMKYISLFDLRYNTKENDHSVFSTRETKDGLEILTNFALEGLSFDLYYDYTDELALSQEAKMILRAKINRENGENVPSPIIRSYRLEFN